MDTNYQTSKQIIIKQCLFLNWITLFHGMVSKGSNWNKYRKQDNKFYNKKSTLKGSNQKCT